MFRILAAVLTALLAVTAPSAQTIFVSPTGSDTTGTGTESNPVRTIMRAHVLANDGATIRLAAGTYGGTAETITLSKQVSVVGAGIGQSTIEAHPTNSRSVDGLTQRVVVLVDTPGRVDLRDLTVDGRFAVSGGRVLTGVYWTRGADGVIDSCEIRNCRADPIASASDHAAVRVVGAATDTASVRIRASWIHQFAHHGVMVRGNAAVVVEDCTVQGAGAVGTTGPLQSGVRGAEGALLTIRACRFADLLGGPASGMAAAIRLLNVAAGSRVDDNDISRCEAGLLIVQTPGSNAALWVRRNRFSQGEVGIQATGRGGLSVHSNVLHGFTTALSDDTANSYQGNNLSDWNGTGSYPVAGVGNNQDTSPSRGCRVLGLPSPVPVGGTPVAVVVAAMDTDPRPDLVTVVEAPSASSQPRVVVALQGAGGFVTATTMFGGLDALPVALVVGALDGNPGLDVAVATSDEGKIHLFRNDGAGALSPLHEITLPAAAAAPSSLAVADLDGDGDMDLLVAARGPFTGPGSAYWLRNDGGGTTWTPVPLPVTITRPVLAIAAADLDGATGPDAIIVEGDTGSGVVHVLRNDGSGNFTAFTGSPFTVAADPTAVATFDLDRNGALDIVVSSTRFALPPADGAVTILRNQPGGFVVETAAVGRLPMAILAGDLDHDDDPDSVRRDVLTVDAGEGALTMLAEFHGQHGFAGRFQCLAGIQPRAASLADATGDGFLDLVVADGAQDQLLVLPSRRTARADTFGRGCPGSSGRIPLVAPGGSLPTALQPSNGLRIELANAPAFAVAVLLAGGTPGSNLDSCQVLLQDIDVSWIAFTNAAGHSQVPIPIPATPDLIGATGFFQWAVLDQGGAFGGLSLTQGLKVRVGF